MNYTEFLDYIKNGCNLFFNNFSNVITSLLSNYFVLTLIGLSLFISLCYLVYRLLHRFWNNSVIETNTNFDSYYYKKNFFDNKSKESNNKNTSNNYWWLNKPVKAQLITAKEREELHELLKDFED